MPQIDQGYVFIPQRLIADLQANPAAIGVYALLARLFLIYQDAIPLSASDLRRYDPALSYGAARGALQRLTALRWLIEQPGHKNRYTPSWGAIKGAPARWRMDAPTLGRPAHIATLRLDRRLLDVGLGKLIPHPTYPAQTGERYVERPILSLRDVGAYAQVLSGNALAATPALWRYGLMRDGQAQPLPGTAELIALASQRTLAGDGAAPTSQGRRTLGLRPPDPPPAPTGQPLFFVDHALIPDPIICSIPDLIPPAHLGESPASAAECAKPPTRSVDGRMAGNPGILREISDSSSTISAQQHSSGGSNQPAKKEKVRAGCRPETEAARLLRAAGAFPSSIEELDDLPADLVERTIAYAQAAPGIASVAGWVVEALRRHRDEGWPIPAPRARPDGRSGAEHLVDFAAYTSGAAGDFFRLGSDTSDLEGCGDERCVEAGAPPSAEVGTAPLEDALAQPVARFPAQGTCADLAQPYDHADALAPDDTLTREVQAELTLRCGRQCRRAIDGLRVHTADGASLLICATVADLEIVRRELTGSLQHILRQLGAPSRITFTTRAGWAARHCGAEDGSARAQVAPMAQLQR